MLVKAFAKINLLLDVTGVLENGYHSIFSVMQSVSLHDTVEVTRNDSGKITVECAEEGVPEDERNIAYKAAKAFFDHFLINDRGVHIKIEKHIPHGAGLAGGSADGAAVIKALCALYDKRLDRNCSRWMTYKVGADVPFCFFGGTALVQNVGDVVSLLPDIDCVYVIAKPKQSVATAGAYSAYDEAADRIRHLDRQGMLTAVLEGDIDKICRKCDNVFEQVIEVQDRAYIKSVMRQCGAVAACMSGSGPSVFGVFKDKEAAEEAYEKLSRCTQEVFICTSMHEGCQFV